MTYVIVGAIIGGFIGAVVYFAKKGEEENQKMIQSLTAEQKTRLETTEITFIEGKGNEWTQEGMIYSMTDKGNKYACKLLWYNRIIKNNFYKTIEYADLTISKEEAGAHHIKAGDFVKVYIAPEKTIGSIKIIYE